MLTAWGIVRDEAPRLPRLVASLDGVAERIVLVDTGSTDGTQQVARDLGCGLIERPWVDFGANRTEAMDLARAACGDDGWLLLMDGDFTVQAVPEFLPWLATVDTLDVLNVQIEHGAHTHRLPLLVRASVPARYVGACHEYLIADTDRVQDVNGLTVTHHADGGTRGPERAAFYEAMLRPEAEAGDPRATYYLAQTLADAGRTDEAIEWYQRRAAMTDGWEEERWHASYCASQLAGDVEGLLDVWRSRPWRHEPLTAAARLIGQGGGLQDSLFVEPAP